MTPSRTHSLAVAALLTLPPFAPAQATGDDAKAAKPAAGDSAEAAVKKLSVAPGLQVDVWASEPLLINPVAFCFDEKGRAFVVETGRRRSSVPDIRRHDAWRIENLGLRSVEERIAFLKMKLPDAGPSGAADDLTDLNKDGRRDWHDLEVEGERIGLVVDSDGDGKADTASVFADGFKALATGTAAGVAASGGSVWFACIPDLWRFDGEKNGATEAQTKLLSGFGVHVAYGGHDMHGTKIGPDGRLYWTIADTGAHVTTREGKVIDNPDSGAVFRCNPDGTDMELFATGLRNPQSLAWNDVGDLFTGDNNADGGDAARWTHVVEGADYGWRIGWQFLPKLGAWNSEGMWHLDVDKTNYAILPPVGHIGHGPAGIAHYPGTGLPDAYRDHFFYADFPGGVRAFALKPKGASYEVVLDKKFQQDNSAQQMTGKLLWGLYPSDVQFGTDGGAYVLDWVYGWEKTGKGRIFRVHDPAVDASQLVLETKRLLGEGMAKCSVDELSKLLGHEDQRVRQAAQFELVKQQREDVLSIAMNNHEKPLARLHAIWGLGQIGRKSPIVGDLFGEALAGADGEEAQMQAVKVIGDLRWENHFDDLLQIVQDKKKPRIRFFVALALGKFASPKAVPALLTILKDNADSDAFVRHAAATALAACADEKTLAGLADDHVLPAGVLLALRRQHSAEVARFLTDANPQLALEAARAIHDAPTPAAYPQLAMLCDKPGFAAPLARRAINAAYRLGSRPAADALAQCAAKNESGDAARLDALEALAQWNEKLGKDRVLGIVVPLEAKRDADAARLALAGVANGILHASPDNIRAAAAEACAALNVAAAESELTALLADEKAGGAARAAALRALAAIKSPALVKSVETALAAKDKALAQAARLLAAKTSPALAVKLNAAVLGGGSIREQQDAITAIGAQTIAEADAVLAAQLDLLNAGKLPAPLALDLLEIAAPRSDAAVRAKLAEFEQHRDAKDPLAKWRECLEGGDAKAGREIFAEKAEAACMRCHKIKGEGGDVGPDLAGIGAKHDRAYILQSIVDPNAVIAPGFENMLVTLKNGDMVAGLLNAEDANDVTLASLADGKKQKIKKADIKERTTVPSAMPPGLGEVLGKRGLRDAIEYLSTVK